MVVGHYTLVVVERRGREGRSCVSFYLLLPCVSSVPQAYGYDDHGISEMWMQTYMGEVQEGAVSASQKAGVGQLSDEAIRVQVWESLKLVLHRESGIIRVCLASVCTV